MVDEHTIMFADVSSTGVPSLCRCVTMKSSALVGSFPSALLSRCHHHLSRLVSNILNYDSETAQNCDKFTSSFLTRAKLFVPAVCPIFCFERIALFIAAFFCYYVCTYECDVHVTVNNVASFWVFNKVVYLTLFRAPMGDEDRPLLWENPLIINLDYLFISLVAKIFGLYLCLPVLPSFPQGFKHPVFEPWTYLKLGLHLHFGRTWSQ